MGNRVVMQEGYDLPFDAYRRKKRRSGAKRKFSGAMKRQQSKMKVCAGKWRKSGTGKYTSFMSRCLKSR